MRKNKLDNKNNTSNNEEVNVIRNYKDTVFCMLFNDKERLLELYNGVNNTHYTNVDDLTINTLENAIYLNMKNDVSCVFNLSLNIYEHQSSYNPNMPLRNLFYVAKLIEKELAINNKKNSIYGEVLVKIPAPQFIVFYNGTDKNILKQCLLLKQFLRQLTIVFNITYWLNFLRKIKQRWLPCQY